MVVDELKVDKKGVDELGVEEMETHRSFVDPGYEAIPSPNVN